MRSKPLAATRPWFRVSQKRRLALPASTRLFFQQKDFEKAEASARQALSLDPGDARCARSARGIYSAKGSKDEAAKEFKAQIEKSPNTSSNYLVLADL